MVCDNEVSFLRIELELNSIQLISEMIQLRVGENFAHLEEHPCETEKSTLVRDRQNHLICKFKNKNKIIQNIRKITSIESNMVQGHRTIIRLVI